MSELTLSKIYKYPVLKSYTGLEGNIPVKHKDVFVGVELEIENVYNTYKLSTNKLTEDGSLKVNGAEFVTIPLKMRYLEIELRRIFESLKDPLVSSRCSTHVHMNVRDMTPEQIVNFILLYMVFERSLYRISGDRWDNNFCVPLYMAHTMMKGFFKAWDSTNMWTWYKYTGLNLCPIFGSESTRIGTVEFRQMHGSVNVEEIMQWCNLITAIKRAAQEIPIDETLAHIKTLPVTEAYGWLAKQVFGRYSILLINQSTFKEDVYKCLTNLKLLLGDKLYVKKKPEVKVDKEAIKISLAPQIWDDLTVAPLPNAVFDTSYFTGITTSSAKPTIKKTTFTTTF